MVISAVEATEPPDSQRVAATGEREPFAFRFPPGFRPVWEAMMVCGVIALAVVGELRLWRAHFRIPWAYHGDGMSTLEAIKSILSGGWNIHTARVGAPFVANSVDFPSGGESMHWLSLKLLGYVLRSPALTDNAYYLLSYFLVALTAYYVARYLGLRKSFALLVGVLYSFLPYHQVHGEIQVVRSAYYVVPLVVLVLLWLVSWRTQFYEQGADGSLRLRRGRIAFAIGVCVVQGVCDTQISGFCICVLALVGGLVAFDSRSTKPLRWALVLAASIAGTLLLVNLPFLVARLTEGSNLAALHRTLLDQDVYGLRLIFMLLPVEGHWLGPLARLTAKAHTAGDAAPTEPGQALGILGGLGFLAITAYALSGSMGPTRIRGRVRSALQTMGMISVVSVLLATVGGFAFLLALFGVNELRTWDRIVVIIGYFAYVGLALLLQQGVAAFFRRYHQSSRPGWLSRRTLTLPLVALLAVVGLIDQSPPNTVPHYRENAAQYNVDANFFAKLESIVPPKSMIFQYPIMVYPENGPVHNLYDYDEFVAYIHTKTLRWSYGGIKGRTQGDWQPGTFSNLPLTSEAAALSAVGFQGIWIARNAYSDHGAALEAALIQLLGPPVLISSDQRMSYFDLTPMTARVDSSMTASQRRSFAAGVLAGIGETYNGSDFGAPTFGATASRWARQTARVTVTNSGAHTLPVVLTGTVSGNGPGRLAISAPGVSASVPLNPRSPSPLNVPLLLARGTTTVTFTASAPGPIGSTGFWFGLSAIEVAPPAVHQGMCVFERDATRPLDCT